MKHFVFLLGRPGCGKSVVYKIIKEILEKKEIYSPRVDDFLTLKEILARDKEFKRHILKDGGFAVTDWTVVDEALSDLCKLVKKEKADKKIIFIEFARDNYRHAFENFTKDVLDDSLILYLYSTFEECYKRNVARFQKAKKDGHDDHIVPLDLMKTYYKTDDYEQVYLKSEKELMEIVPAKTVVLDSTVSGETGMENLRKQIEKEVINELF
ncbi:MAG: hypothetical protein BWK68_00060 [Elusimicrobia bacterium A5]|nr:MAG: hypothetical protein BWK68_00060 [Elusimicrobia bacterium A5]